MIEAPTAKTTDFVAALLAPGDVITIRPIESWLEGSRKRPRADYKGIKYLTRAELTEAKLCEIAARSENKKTHTFFGVCPRFGGGGKYDKAWQIRVVRALWADLDHIAVAEAIRKVESAGLPRPSIVVSSGNGVHLYWLLDSPYLIDDCGDPPPVESEWTKINGKSKKIEFFVDEFGERVNLDDPQTGKPVQRNVPELSAKAVWVQDVLQGLAAAIGSDHTHDLSRLLRLPGTMNRKDERNGATPKPCELVENNGARYALELFARFAGLSPAKQAREKIASAPLPVRRRMTEKRQDTLATLIHACGASPVGERSEADFRLCCWCIEHGLTSGEIWNQVSGVGKFAERGEDYFLRTWGAAELRARRKVVAPGGESAPAGDDHGDTDDQRVRVPLTTHEHAVNDAVIDALAADEALYQRAEQLVTILTGSKPDDAVKRPEDAPRIAGLSLATVRERISKCVDFQTKRKSDGGEIAVSQHVPDWCCRAVHARGEWRGIRPLRGISSHPVVKPDGSILTQPGYDPQTGLILHWQGEPLVVADQPTRADAVAAVSRLNALVSDFPFEVSAHRSGWLAFLLTGLVRHAFPQPICAPLFLFDANTPGTGKGLCVDVASMIVLGFAPPRMTMPGSDDEMRKTLLAVALAGDEVLLLDNVAGELGCPSLDAALTSTSITGRVLGETKQITAPFGVTLSATSNNCTIRGDTCRRIIHVRLSSPLEKPEERTGFHIPNLLQYVRDHRRELLADALTVLRAFHVAGRPDQKLPAMGSYEDWSSLVRNSLVWAGEPDPGATRVEFARQADSDLHALGEMLRWWKHVDPSGKGKSVSEVLRRLEMSLGEFSGLRGAVTDFCDTPPGSLPTPRKLGKRLAAVRNRIYQGERFVGDDDGHGVLLWRVESAAPQTHNPGVSGCLEASNGDTQSKSSGCPGLSGCFSSYAGEENVFKEKTLLHIPTRGGLPDTRKHPDTRITSIAPEDESGSIRPDGTRR